MSCANITISSCACNGGIHISAAPSLSPALFFGEECRLNEECKSGICGDGSEIATSIFHGKLLFNDDTKVFGGAVLTFFPNDHLKDLSSGQHVVHDAEGCNASLTHWRLSMRSTQSYWEVGRVHMYSGSKQLIPVNLFTSKNPGLFDNDVLTDENPWIGILPTDEKYFIGFEFSEPTCVTKAVWQNSNKYGPDYIFYATGEVKLEGKRGNEWIEYAAKDPGTEQTSDEEHVITDYEYPLELVNVPLEGNSAKWRKIPRDESSFALQNVASGRCITSPSYLMDCNSSNPAQSLRVENVPYPVQRCTPDVSL